MFYHNINPVLFSIGSLEIRWYGIIFVIGFLIAYFMIGYLAKRKALNLTKDDTADLLFYLVIGILIGARAFYVFIYNAGYYISNPLESLMFWHGGLSFHGGLVGAVIAAWIFCRKKKLSMLELGDIIVIPLAIGLCLGRIANFINGELVGRVTNLPWCVSFKGYEGCRHPSQLYESAKNLVLFISLWCLKDIKIKDKAAPKGFLFFSFVMGYSVLRFFIEFVRAPDPQLGFIVLGLTMGQLLNILMFLAAIYGFHWIFKKK